MASHTEAPLDKGAILINKTTGSDPEESCVGHLQSLPQKFSAVTVLPPRSRRWTEYPLKTNPKLRLNREVDLFDFRFPQKIRSGTVPAFFVMFFFFFSRCSYSLLVMNNSAENIWTHFLLLVLHTHRKCLGDPRWAMLRAIIIGAHDAGRALKMNKWTDIYGLHLLSSCLHDYTCVVGNMDLLREESVTVNSYPLLHGSVWHWEAYSGWELIFSISFLSDGILHEHSIFYQS